jgi:hypothetical protein
LADGLEGVGWFFGPKVETVKRSAYSLVAVCRVPGAGIPLLLLLLLAATVPFRWPPRQRQDFLWRRPDRQYPDAGGEVEQVVEDVAQNGVIRGTKEYNKDEFVAGAKAADLRGISSLWTRAGRFSTKCASRPSTRATSRMAATWVRWWCAT